MAYLQQQSSNQKMVTMGAVAAIHAIAIYAVVSGLAVNIIPRIDPRIIGMPVEKPKPPEIPPPPEEPVTKIDKTVKPVIPDVAIPPIGGNPVTPLDLGPTGGEIGAGGGEVAVVEFPRPPEPEPKPLFAAKGPKARGSQANWVTQDHYPTPSIRLGHEGLTKVRLTVGTNGRVTDCAITASSGHTALDSASCEWLTKRARFDPATDTSGQVTQGTFTTSVRWQLPDE